MPTGIYDRKPRRSLEERFWEKVEKTDSCWLWKGACVKGGYGNIWNGKDRNEQTHRLSWKMENNEDIPDGMQVLHICDTPNCVNPDHLFLGDNDDNVKDRTKKQRHWANQRPDEFREHAKKMGVLSRL